MTGFTSYRLILGTVFAGMLLLFSAQAQAVELVMFESVGCEWCETWDEEIGTAYDKTSEARVAPLRRVDIDDERPEDLQSLQGLMFTPTFIVMSEGKEVGRIIGYPGEEFFWQLLDEILANEGIKLADGT